MHWVFSVADFTWEIVEDFFSMGVLQPMTVSNPDYAEGNVKVQLALVTLLFLAGGIFFYVQSLISGALADIQLLAVTEPVLAIKLAGRLLLWLVLFSGSVSIAIGCYLVTLVRHVRVAGLYPPPSMPVAMKTPILRGAESNNIVLGCKVLAVVLFIQPLVGLYIWYAVTGAAW